MRNNRREVTALPEILDILNRCDTISLGMNAEDAPYVVPLTFGCRMEGGQVCLYFHCAGDGRKWELLHRNPWVCVEGHRYERVELTGSRDITARFESVIGSGKAELIQDPAMKLDAIQLMLSHYRFSGFPVTSCAGMSRVEIFRVALDTVTGKRNLSDDSIKMNEGDAD